MRHHRLSSGRYYGRAGRREIMRHQRVALLELIQKRIRQRDLDGACPGNWSHCWLRGYANDTQLQSLFNYMMRTGDAARFNTFTSRCMRIPQHKGEIMTIADGITSGEGHRNGLQQGRRPTARRIAIARAPCTNDGFDRDTVLGVTGLAPADLASESH